MEITALPRESSAVRCAICARPARRGATLCAQCKAAVKRARQVQKVHSEYLPHPMAASSDSGSLSGVLEPAMLRAYADRVGVPGPGWGTYATLVVFGVAVCLTGYLALGELEDASTALHESLALQAQPAKPAADANGARAPSNTIDESDAVARVDASAAASGAEPGTRGAEDRKPAREPRQVITMTMSTADADSEPKPVQDEGSAIAAAPPPVEVREVAEPVPDRQQLLAAALSRCERENVVVGLFCKESARLKYCDGQWGSTPQCPVGVASNNTR